ncbi:two-component system OmpR family response regulator [Arthrobacter globiformis]|uniref:response regulator transcription factor n=1 Tax=Arthrobacter globiformis TaxID=1665 RepID=UPI00278A3653|nr:response regulator transcription factor [Arthrobacter globiformis]MDQ1059608.1 two-component system OmpR family response regulator [Arthrobacter globiformis]
MNDRRVVVVIDMDEEVRSSLQATLGEGGFEVHCAATGESGVALVRAMQPDTVTLDLVLPDTDGYDVLRRIREFSHTYILIITARRDLRATLKGFDAGADDYMVKPIRPRELRARVDGMLRRPRQLTVPPIVTPREPPLVSPRLQTATTEKPAQDPALAQGLTAVHGLATAEGRAPDRGYECSYKHKGLELDCVTRAATLGGRTLQLTRTEFDLLHILLERGSGVVTKAELVGLLGLVRREPGNPEVGVAGTRDPGRIIETHVGNLRRKLGDDARKPRWLKTVRGSGYTLA